MGLVQRIKLLSDEKKMSFAELERKLGFANSSIRKWDERTPGIDKIQKVADYFDVSTDYLLGRTEKKKYYELNDKEKKDIAIQAEELIEGLTNGENLNFYGEPATQDQKDRLLIAIRTAMEMNKEEAKKKFTRKDYRN
ncbi:helix-turn-helix domain-containing protein [Enterococcus faecalis]|uniref:helix-turn-helix domain-containing protein n=1 Tax=Enterococcus faecalis TaxID=1351 RepID=UPI001E2A0161|nr:helix-turn-helix transcriptional regulator [Enterococcus faecalis]MCE2545246.1 helix-turn-helix transcriptional regulator [Enterococcus faecalis]UJQ89226.1 helix-turn-helix transcriptional regulator [Enterococcus faecalis]HAP4448080.1 helix-turn-helix transcriptional regulator [Enterococcus faecalis]HAP4458655.1 helix-turn-helix transcriptional regulator [Enterococcus faecalis]HAP4459834.1 helix-turn-helix transcriptional regulator [Enterococcus faecalis]